MKLKELKNLRTKSLQELQTLLGKKMLEIMKVRINVKVSKEKNLKRVKMLKRDVSQIKTIIKEMELLEEISKGKKESEV